MSNIYSSNDLPLNALRAFEAAARHLSFTLAASELNVTQGAISRQIKTLEDQIGFPLFHRLHRKLVLTDKGRALFQPITQALGLMVQAMDTLQISTRVLNLKTHSTFAMRWLIPRLHKFHALHPKVHVRFTTSNINTDFKTENFDIAVQFGGKETPGIIREKIIDERLTPVCSPKLLTSKHPLKSPQDLAHHILLYNSPDQREWRIWAKQTNTNDLMFNKGQTFEIDDAALQAAVAGLGVALGDKTLIKNDLKSGMLMEPFEYIPVTTDAYYLAWIKGNTDKPGLLEFKTWLIQEIQST